MRIGIHSWGSEGDIRPFLALGHGLAGRGHEVTLAYTAVDGRDYSALARRSGIRARAVGARYFAQAREALDAATRDFGEIRNPLRQLRKIVELALEPVADEMFQASAELCATTEVEIVHFLHHPAATAALAAGRPFAPVFTAPAIPSRHLPPMGAPDLGRLLNPLVWRLTRVFLDSIFKTQVNALRAKAGLPLVRNAFAEGLHCVPLSLTAVSPALFPRPDDWEPRHELCGFFHLADSIEAWEPPTALAELLRRGPRPVYFTFGSILSVDRTRARDSVRLMAEAAALARLPAILQLPPELLGEIPPSQTLQLLDHAPHSRIFPRCAAVVHHGGAGTTQTATAAGCPSVVVAHGVDQFFWGKLLQRRGLAPALLDRRDATAAELAARIRWVIDRPALKSEAERVGAAMRAEDGVARAAQLIEQRLAPEAR